MRIDLGEKRTELLLDIKERSERSRRYLSGMATRDESGAAVTVGHYTPPVHVGFLATNKQTAEEIFTVMVL